MPLRFQDSQIEGINTKGEYLKQLRTHVSRAGKVVVVVTTKFTDGLKQFCCWGGRVAVPALMLTSCSGAGLVEQRHTNAVDTPLGAVFKP